LFGAAPGRIRWHEQRQGQGEDDARFDSGPRLALQLGDGEIDFVLLQQSFGFQLIGFAQSEAQAGMFGPMRRQQGGKMMAQNRAGSGQSLPASPRSWAATSSSCEKKGSIKRKSWPPDFVRRKGRR
jgi:hypothetical protein